VSSTVAVFGPWVSNPTWLIRTVLTSGSALAAPKATAKAAAPTLAANLFLTHNLPESILTLAGNLFLADTWSAGRSFFA
jgi:hypothetical protein